MSKTIECPDCGQPMDVPAYPGDGVYSRHWCNPQTLARLACEDGCNDHNCVVSGRCKGECGREAA